MNSFDRSGFGPRDDMQSRSAEAHGVLAVLVAAVVSSALFSGIIALLSVAGFKVAPIASLWIGLAAGAGFGVVLQRCLSRR